MTLIYGIAVGSAALATIALILVTTGKPSVDVSPALRRVLSALLGFGMAGLSASFAGWGSGPALAAAIAGGVGLGLLSDWFASESG